MKSEVKIHWLQIDFLLLFSVLLLIVIGAAVVFSASSFKADNLMQQRLQKKAVAAEKAGDMEKAAKLAAKAKTVDGSAYYIKKQAGKIFVGLLLMMLVASVPYERWLGLSPLFLLASIFLLALLFTPLPIVVSRDEASRWLNLFGFTFQPSDFARYALLLFLARFLYEMREMLSDWRAFLMLLGVAFVVIGLIAVEKDLGTAAMVTLTVFVMFWFAGVKSGFLFLTGMSFFALALIYLQLNHYMIQRMITFIGPLFGHGEPSFQIQQSLISFALGGAVGVGIGNSVQKYEFLPEAYKDMVFSILGEELGFIGTVGVLLLFALIMYRGIRIARSAPNEYGRLLAGGITACIMLYTVINVAVALALLPTTGIPMPFISYGGSALISHLIGIGLLLNISARGSDSNHRYETGETYRSRVKTMPFFGTSRMNNFRRR
ncbi:MAG: cell division protein FtsW [Calditrichaeota bacterium]|nr:MAG: cell division protein FtsW [Calditrichota bacterium]